MTSESKIMTLSPSKSAFKGHDFNSEETQILAALSICILFFGVGVPVWWKTTNVYRADLPYHEISKLHGERQMTVQIFVDVINENTPVNCNTFTKNLNHLLNENGNQTSVGVVYKVTCHDERETAKVNKVNHIYIIFTNNDERGYGLRLTTKREVICSISDEKSGDSEVLELVQSTLTSLIRDVMVRESILKELVSNIHQERKDFSHDQEMMKMIQGNLKFDILFSLLCPEPNEQVAEWNIEEADDLYLKAMLEKVEPVFDFNVGSQTLYYTLIPYAPKVKKDNSNNVEYHYLTHNQLSLVINPIEGRLGSQVSADPTLNFVVYVTEKKFQPLYIQKNDKNLSQSNTFLIPRWGALMFYNMNDTFNVEGNSYKKGIVDTNTIMKPFLNHLRALMGIQNPKPHLSKLNVMLHQLNYDGIADWELDYLIRLRTLERIASATHTLNSLYDLLSKISNIVINDNIAEEVYKATETAAKAKALLATGDLSEALNISKISFKSSETAFFDPTLLELLYFPEDQKFAIYVPLFLPISLPVFVSLVYTIRRLKNAKKSKTD
ncbi:GPI-anchor transamidase component PIGS-like [Clavelina lepadiformis]|uniref:GPI-anchor transamidase component PIGS-like n=1 Tax=Clavelina lepadiformis TaxID=159417 RepID=UPI0040429C22